MRIAFLILLSRKPYHGYEMMKEVEDRTEGFWKPTAGGVYPILQSLEKAGYIKGEWAPQKRKRKIYHITESGKLILDRALLKHSHIDEARDQFYRALQIDYDYAEAHNNLGIVLALNGNLDDAIKHYRTALNIKPDYYDAYYNLGKAYQAQANPQAAIEAYDEALKLFQDSPHFCQFLILFLLSTHRILCFQATSLSDL